MTRKWPATGVLVEVHRATRFGSPRADVAPGAPGRRPERRARPAGLRTRYLGRPELPARTHTFDPGYEPPAVAEHLEQCAHLMASLKLSVQKGGKESSREKIALARSRGLPVVAAIGPDEISFRDRDRALELLALCAELGASRVEVGSTGIGSFSPSEFTTRAKVFGLGVQVELGLVERNRGLLNGAGVKLLVGQGKAWLEAGATQLSLRVHGVGPRFSDEERTEGLFAAARIAEALDPARVAFEAPTRAVQLAFLRLFGRNVRLSNVRLEELLHLEMLRRGEPAEPEGGSAGSIASASRR